MLKPTTFSLTVASVVSLLFLWGGPAPVLAAVTCQTSQGICHDAKTGETRNCTTKVCTDEKGKVVSTETVVEKKGSKGTGASTGPTKPPVPPHPAGNQ